MNYFINSAIITNIGVFELSPITAEQAKAEVLRGQWLSAIGHESTAIALSVVLQREVKMNRIQITFEVGEKAIVFKPKGRLPEGVVLTLQELEGIGWEIFLLERLK
jgi:hypothetical protein